MASKDNSREVLQKSSTEQNSAGVGEGGDPIPQSNLMKVMRGRKANSETGSSNGGSNSGESALVSLGNTSFGFNFDSEEGLSNTSPPNESEQNSSEEDGDQQDAKPPATSITEPAKPARVRPLETQPSKSSISSLTASASSQSGSGSALKGAGQSNINNQVSAGEVAMANASVDNRDRIVSGSSVNVSSLPSSSLGTAKPPPPQTAAANQQLGVKRQLEHQQEQHHRQLEEARNNADKESGGYSSDDDEENEQNSVPASMSGNASAADSTEPRQPKKKKLNDKKRVERNAREKERSLKISQQINELRNLLSSGGVAVPKGTKSSVLTEAANYIRMLQQHQYRSEIDRQQLVQQMQVIGSGAQGPQAATTIRHVAAQNGVWSLGNFGGMPPKSAMTFDNPGIKADEMSSSKLGGENSPAEDPANSLKIEPNDYRFVFNSCGFAMAVASMGGAFLDCNQLFSQITRYSKQELCSQTIFNLTARHDLQNAFDEISRLISSPVSATTTLKPVLLQCSLTDRGDLGLSVSLVRGEDLVAKCFCVTLIKNPATHLDAGKPIPLTFIDVVMPCPNPQQQHLLKDTGRMDSSPAFTSG